MAVFGGEDALGLGSSQPTELDFDDEVDAVPQQTHSERPAYEETPAQRTMKEDILGVHKLDAVLDETFGDKKSQNILSTYGLFDSQVSEMALQVINDGPDLALSMKQWAAVQALIENGIRYGWNRGRDSRN